MTGRSESDWDGAWLGILILLGILVFVAYTKAPQAFGFLIGSLVGGTLVLVGVVDTRRSAVPGLGRPDHLCRRFDGHQLLRA